MDSIPQNGYSATVEAFLLVGDHKLWIQRIGGGMLMVREPSIVPPGTRATVEVTIDGHKQTSSIVLVNGIQPGVDAIEYR